MIGDKAVLDFYSGKRVLVTGHTGFKGSWMCKVLELAGANVTGYALMPPTRPSLYKIAQIEKGVQSVLGDVRDLKHLKKQFEQFRPEIVIHMAAQPLVRESYLNPVYTYETNVMGTVNVLECIRHTDSVRSFVNVTTDKVYCNREWHWGYRENEELNGYDPYSNSKSCSELVTDSYRKSFWGGRQDLAVSTCRAGNVIGGGDFAEDRIVPDCIRAAAAGEVISLRNPLSVRPYQHVLEPVLAYLMVAMKQYEDKSLEGSYNIGPGEESCITTGALASLFCAAWEKHMGKRVEWKSESEEGFHEANFLKLDCSKIKAALHWEPKWSIAEAMDRVVAWMEGYLSGQDMAELMESQIREYIARGVSENV